MEKDKLLKPEPEASEEQKEQFEQQKKKQFDEEQDEFDEDSDKDTTGKSEIFKSGKINGPDKEKDAEE